MFPISRQFQNQPLSKSVTPKRLPSKVANNYKHLQDMIDLEIKQAKLKKLQDELKR